MKTTYEMKTTEKMKKTSKMRTTSERTQLKNESTSKIRRPQI